MDPKPLKRRSSEEIEAQILTKEFLEIADYDYRRNTISEDPNYTLFLTISDSKEHFDGICKIELILVENFTDLFLDFKGEIQRIWVNKTMIYYNHESPDSSHLYNGSIILINKSFLKPHLNSITVEYRGHFTTESKGLYSVDNTEDERRFYYTLSEPNHAGLFMPIVGQLNVKGSFKVYINHPKEYKAISNNEVKTIGTLRDDGFFEAMIERFDKIGKFIFWSKLRMKYFDMDYVVTEFHTTGILCFNMFAFAVGSFEQVETSIVVENRTLTLSFFARKEWISHLISVKDVFARLIQYGIKYFEDLTGKVFPYKKYDTLFVKEFHLDAIETPGMVIMYEEYIKFRELNLVQQLGILKVFLHEIAHMWFVSINWWSDLWIKEGISEYMAFVVMESLKLSGQNDFLDHEVLEHIWTIFNEKLFESFDFEKVNQMPLNPFIPDTQNLLKYYNPVPYQKGAMFFRSLHLLIGQKSFRAILRKITNFYSHHNISTSILYNLIKVMIRSFDEEDVCLINEELFEKFWFDSVMLPFYSVIQVTTWRVGEKSQELQIEFESREIDAGFEETIREEYFEVKKNGTATIHSLIPVNTLEFHSCDEMVSKQISPWSVINRRTISQRHNFFQVLVLDENCTIRFEGWCRISMTEDRVLRIPDVGFTPKAVLLNARFESYCRILYDKRTLQFLLVEKNILKLSEEPLRVSVYLSVATGPWLKATSPGSNILAGLHYCIGKENKLIKQLLLSKLPPMSLS